eukprot:TRINITY_DN2588_c0_g1_i6.p2 TRINITY_DN2588_c0_g1~~TRINITY_DN2588_c0_g1_i6.p2  ORF type:complete len:184 (+),score=50.07 TRINITY_DN2588_c0_g1_i6:573-1124(+)
MTPQIFDTQIEFESQQFEIEESYGTNFREENLKQYFKIETIMAGNKQNNEIKGGIILIKLKKCLKNIEINDSNQDKFSITYEMAQTKEKIKKSDTFNLSQQFVEQPLNSYTNQGIRKAVFLAIYSDFVEKKLKNQTKLNLQELCSLIEYLEKECQAMNTKDLYKEIEILQRIKQQFDKQQQLN